MNTSILPFWKKIGTSSSIIAKRVSEKLNLPTSHTGTLDPMAEGVVKIIVGEDSKNKEKFISENKTYNFKIIFGISTDTHDALGLIDKILTDVPYLEKEYISNSLKTFVGPYHQKYPNYSSKKVNGKSLWEYERLGLPVPEVFIDGEIKKIDFIDFDKISGRDMIEKIISQIGSIKGNFRQKEILDKYQEIYTNEYFQYIELNVVMTRGLYVRGFARDLGIKLNIPCMILDLVRLEDGATSKEDCLHPEDYFKEEILKNQNFLFPDFKKL